MCGFQRQLGLEVLALSAAVCLSATPVPTSSTELSSLFAFSMSQREQGDGSAWMVASGWCIWIEEPLNQADASQIYGL